MNLLQESQPIYPQEKNQFSALLAINDLLRQGEVDGSHDEDGRISLKFILPKILQKSAEELNAHAGTIIVVDPKNEVEYGWLLDGKTSKQTTFLPFWRAVLSDGIAGLAMRTLKPIDIADTLQDNRWLTRSHHITARESWSALCAPFVVGARAVGAITITKPGRNAFNTNDIDVLTMIANQTATTIENARLYGAMKQKLADEELFNRISLTLNSTLEPAQQMKSLLAMVSDRLKVEAVSLAINENDTIVFKEAFGAGAEMLRGHQMPIDEGVAGSVWHTGQAVVLNNPRRHPNFTEIGYRVTGIRTRAMICVPVKLNENEVLGVIQAINPRTEQFTEDDHRMLERLATMIATALKNADIFNEKAEAEARYLNLFDDSIDPIILTSLAGDIRAVNARAIEFLGFAERALLGEKINKLRPSLKKIAHDILQSPTDVKKVTTHIAKADGTEIPVEIHVKQLVSSDIYDLQWIFHDISKQVELETMRNDLTAMLFHDLQNPLSNIISSLELMQMELPEDSDPVVSMMAIVAYRSSQRLGHLVRSLLDVNRLEAGAPVRDQASVSVGTMFQYIGEMMEASVERKFIHIAYNYDPLIPAIYANKDMVERVLINLMDNAVKFSKRDDTITLSAEYDPSTNMITFSVSDEGPGIPAQYRASIFEKFYRTPDNTSKGIGLGLAFCRLAVEGHGGHIWADEADSGGAKFCFTIPAAA